MAEYSTMRRVITAQNERGEGFVALDDRVEPIIAALRNPGQQLWQLWGYDGIPQLPDDGSAKFKNSIFAPPGGYRVQICEFPGEVNNLTPRGEWPPLGTNLGRLDTGEVSTEVGDVDGDVVHYTDSVDLIIVLEGEVTLRLSDGDVTVKAGDVMIINGAPHAWRLSGKPCRICMVALGAERN